jgi:hypothetical protein
MNSAPTTVAQLSDHDLVAEVGRLAQSEREETAALVAALSELDARRLYLAEGYASLFAYCTQRLHYSEHAAYHRIEAARAARRFPLVLERLREGELTLTAVGLLRPHLTEANHREVLDAARRQGKRAVEEIVARLHARPDVRAAVRRLPAPRASAAERTTPTCGAPTCGVPQVADPGLLDPGGKQRCLAPQEATQELSPTRVDSGARQPCLVDDEATQELRPAPVRPPVVRPLAPARYQVQMTVSAETHAKLRRAQDLLRHVVPNGDPAAVFDRALTLLVEHLERTRCAATKRRGEPESSTGSAPRRPSRPTEARASVDAAGRSRHIPAAVKRAVWARDGGRCAFVGPAGRCSERGFLEFHHREPFAAGGRTTVMNVALRCRQHNQWETEQFFGARAESG